METIQIELKNKKQSLLIKELLKELKINYKPIETTEREKTIDLYGKQFVDKIERGDKEYENGECVEVNLDDLWK